MKNILLLLTLLVLNGCAYDPQYWQNVYASQQQQSQQQQQRNQQFINQQYQQLQANPVQPYYIPPIQRPVEVNVHVYDGGGLPTSQPR